MTNILFICHGNICRSPTAEFIMKEILLRAGMAEEFHIESAATSTEELGNAVYPPSRRLLNAYGIDCSKKRARQIESSDYGRFDYIIGMDSYNFRNLMRRCPESAKGKIRNLLDHAGRIGQEVADPWYSGEFETTWRDIMEGCAGLMKELTGIVVLDFSMCRCRTEIFDELAKKLNYEKWYGRNLDALWDILSGLPHGGERFAVMPPFESAGEDICNYVAKIEGLFRRAGKLC